jgi:ABC-type oligopeptide transport system ATPase subunit
MSTHEAQTAPPLLEVRDLSLSFTDKNQDRQIAIDRVSFNVEAGSTLGLIGSSGAGKSSIARAILQLVEPDDGEILFNGTNVRSMTGPQLMTTRQRLQIVFQEPAASLSPRLTIARILHEPLQHFAIGDREHRQNKVEQTLQTVGLDKDVLQRFPHQFSAGQQQRIAIARALVTSPDLLIADEAVSSLDVSIQAQILQLIQSLQREHGIAILFISHDLGVIRQIADRVAVMYQGQLLEQSTADTFFNGPAHPYSKALLSFARLDDPDSPVGGQWQLSHGRKSAKKPSNCLYAGNCADKMPLCELREPENHNIHDNGTAHYVKCHIYGGMNTNDN